MSKCDVKGGDSSRYLRAPAPCQAQETLLKAVWDVQAKAGPEIYDLRGSAWAGQQQNSRETCGQCKQAETLPQGTKMPSPFLSIHLPRPGSGADPSYPGSLP